MKTVQQQGRSRNAAREAREAGLSKQRLLTSDSLAVVVIIWAVSVSSRSSEQACNFRNPQHMRLRYYK
jgi:hypothetical protein